MTKLLKDAVRVSPPEGSGYMPYQKDIEGKWWVVYTSDRAFPVPEMGVESAIMEFGFTIDD